ncbi:efflux RND transporter permease subunit [Paracoccaceae bacterium GXU_MW_L88]
MNSLIDAAFSRTRFVVMTLVMLLMIGLLSYMAIPKESNPEVKIPVMYVSTGLEGISPEDAERLLISPLETELSSLEGLKTMTGNASQGHASVQLEFDAGFDADEALDKVQEAVDRAKPDLPADADDPVVTEINTALFPIFTVVMYGPLPERTLIRLADELQTDLEALSGVLEAEVAGDREQLMEVLIDPTVFETYQISFDELITLMTRNNRLIAAGAIETGAGRMVLKVPGLIEDIEDVMNMPVKVTDKAVLTFRDVATVRSTFQDPQGFARINGQPAISLEIKKRVGANIIETVNEVKAVIEASAEEWPDSLEVEYMQDESEQVVELLTDLQNNVIAAVILVMLTIIWALGIRSSILVGLAIPGSFLAGVTLIWAMGYTMNIIVLFSLILVVGMLVDGAIVTTELADRRLHEGWTPRDAYAYAAKRMAWPIIASTATTVSVFVPLLFWDSVIGEFMKFMPITVILTLLSSLLMALIFIPVLGGLIGKRQPQSAKEQRQLWLAEKGDPTQMTGLGGFYIRLLRAAIWKPFLTLLTAIAMIVAVVGSYMALNHGVGFFPATEPDFMQVQVRARDSFSIYERDKIIRRVEDRLIGLPDVQSVYARTMSEEQARMDGEDVIGAIQLELTEWNTRPTAEDIGNDIREMVSDIPGIQIQISVQEDGPPQGQPISIKVIGYDPEMRNAAVDQLRGFMDEMGGFRDVNDTRPVPGVEFLMRVDREEAARYGADIALLGQAVQLLTVGIEAADYKPADADDTVDIRVRFPSEERTLENLENLRIPTNFGLVPIRNFVTFTPAPRTGVINREDSQRVTTVNADVQTGVLPDDQVRQIQGWLAEAELPPGISIEFQGEAEDQQDAMIFLLSAFVAAVFLMFTTLLIQFNSFYKTVLVLSAILFSISGVLLGLLLTGRPFIIVMGGIAIIALAGIVVNNNIVLIDTYDQLRRDGLGPREAVLRTGAQRLRPVMLTSVTTVLGLMPMVLALNINFVERSITVGAPSTQMWTALSSGIAGGMFIATLLTLVLTPALLMLGENWGTATKRFLAKRRLRKRERRAQAAG